jgi:hypothetical protein
MSATDKTPGHRARELLNLIQWATCCAALPEADEAERASWRSEVHRAWAELQGMCPRLSAREGPGAEPPAGDWGQALADRLDAAAGRGAAAEAAE